MLPPLVFTPYLRPQIWGGRLLQDVLGKRLPDARPYGESWELSAHATHVSRVADGPWQQTSLTDLWSHHRGELLGGTAEQTSREFPLLVKYLDCHELLSIQVHPNDAVAHELLGEAYGKTEAWLVLEAHDDSRVYAGLKAGVTRSDLTTALHAGRLSECLHSFQPRVGDCVFIPAGTVHSGHSIVVAEVQQSSDATFRLYDWDRPGPDGQPRPLHWDQAMRAIDWNRGPISPQREAPLTEGNGSATGSELVHCEHFRLERWVVRDAWRVPPGPLSVWMIVDGGAELRGPGDDRRVLRRGSSVLIPGALENCVWQALDSRPVVLLRAVLPPGHQRQASGT